jgi:hypothetical protein
MNTNPGMRASPIFQHLLPASLVLSALEALAAVVYLVSIPGDPKNSLLLGLSLSRLALAVLLVTLGVGSMVLAVLYWRRKGKATALLGKLCDYPKPYLPLLGLLTGLFLVSWILTFTPAYRFEAWGAYVERLRPLAAWLGLIALQNCILLAAGRGNPTPLFDRSSRRLWLVVLIILTTLWICFRITGLGIRADPISWNQPGVPLLSLQILTVWMISAGVYLIEDRLPQKRWLEPVIFVGIWMVAALIWNLAPFPGSFFSPGPYPPETFRYPFSDAAKYDIAAQFVFIGKGLNSWNFTDKPLYSGLLYLFHLIAGQNYDGLIALQASTLALLPALVYTLGRRFHSRTAGVAVAMLVVFKEYNAIVGSQFLLSSHSRLMLSEVPMALVLVVFILLLARWLENPVIHWKQALMAGGVLGLGTLVRHNTWVLVPTTLLLTWLAYGKPFKNWLRGAAGFLLLLFLAIAPWMVRSSVYNSTPFYFLVPLQGSVFPNRLGEVEPTPTPTAPTEALEPTQIPAIIEKSSTPAYTEPTSWYRKVRNILEKIPNVINFASSHLAHNLITSALILPVSLKGDSFEGIVTSPGSLWSPEWDGQLNLNQSVFFAANLVVIGLGISLAWKRMRWAGVSPLVIFMAYQSSNALARTSGGRYLVPTDWVLLFYFAVGISHFVSWAVSWLVNPQQMAPVDVQSSSRTTTRKPVHQLVSVAIIFLVIGSTLPIVEQLYPARFVGRVKLNEETFNTWLPADQLAEAGYQTDEIRSFLGEIGSTILTGRVLYPRFYGINQGEHDRFSAYATEVYPRLAFTHIGLRLRGIILPLNKSPEFFPQASEVSVIGCRRPDSDIVDALLVVMVSPERQVLVRQPAAPLACPISIPVCDNNRLCK